MKMKIKVKEIKMHFTDLSIIINTIAIWLWFSLSHQSWSNKI